MDVGGGDGRSLRSKEKFVIRVHLQAVVTPFSRALLALATDGDRRWGVNHLSVFPAASARWARSDSLSSSNHQDRP